MTFGEKVKQRRVQMQMNQKELAEAAEITQATISRIESGLVRQLKSEALKRLAIALDVSADYLVGITDKEKSRRRGFLGFILRKGGLP